jgi:hypothetical protein
MWVSEGPPIEPIPRARAVADAPVDALLASADGLARRWLLALIEARPLGQIAELPLAALARDAPALCEQVVSALACDSALERLLDGNASAAREGTPPGAAARALALSASDASSTAASLEALRSVIWHQALVELRDPPTALVGELADRLAFLCATLLATALAAGDAESAGAASPARGAAASAPRAPLRRSERSLGRGAVLIDELEEELRPLATGEPPPPTTTQAPASARVQRPPAGVAPEPARRPSRGARPWDMPLREERGASDQPPDGDAAGGERAATSGEEPTLRIRRASDVHYDELR